MVRAMVKVNGLLQVFTGAVASVVAGCTSAPEDRPFSGYELTIEQAIVRAPMDKHDHGNYGEAIKASNVKESGVISDEEMAEIDAYIESRQSPSEKTYDDIVKRVSDGKAVAVWFRQLGSAGEQPMQEFIYYINACEYDVRGKLNSILDDLVVKGATYPAAGHEGYSINLIAPENYKMVLHSQFYGGDSFEDVVQKFMEHTPLQLEEALEAMRECREVSNEYGALKFG